MATPDDVDQMMSNLPKNELVMVKRLRALIMECIPYAEEKAYYGLGVPFYRHNKLICFIWPPSVVWQSNDNIKKQQAKGVTLGFNQGYLMSNEDGILLSEGRKQVYAMYFKKFEDIDEQVVRALLFEAAMIDEEFGMKRKAKKEKKK